MNGMFRMRHTSKRILGLSTTSFAQELLYTASNGSFFVEIGCMFTLLETQNR